MMSMSGNHAEASPLATLCYKAGSTLDEVLALEEEELFELSKEIVGNTVLDHARVLKQWRRCRLEEVLRKEVEAELQNEGRDDENETQVQLSLVDETLQQQQQEKLERYRKEQQEQIREDWQEYLRKQARREMLHHHELLADDSVPCAFIEARGAQSTTSSPHQSSQDDCSFEEEETWYSVNDVPALFDVGKVALEVMGFIGDGLNDLLLGPSEENEKPKSKKHKKKKSKSKRECTTTTTTTRETSNFNATEETDFWQQHHLPKLSLLL